MNVPPSASREFAGVRDHLFSLKAHGTKFGIDRMRELCERIGHPERATPCIHVAGTNGKGSVAAMLDSILRSAGWRTGLFTSPHLVHMGERVQVDRRPLSDAEIIAYVRELEPTAHQIRAANPELAPSFFEYMAAMGFLQFSRTHCDIAVIEVGLGGRLDATNIVAPEVSVITSIGLDHCDILGRDVQQIAREKAGIIKPGVPVVLGRMPPEAEAAINDVAREVGAPVRSVGEEYGGGVEALPSPGLEGEYQRWNAATATLAAGALRQEWRITPGAIEQGLRSVDWPGRWQHVRVGSRHLVLDASHNAEGAGVLDQNLAQLTARTGRAPIVVTGALGAERAEPLLRTICRHAREIHLVVPREPRACSHDQLQALVPVEYRGSVVRDSLQALFPAPGECSAGSPGDVIVVTGSIHLVGEVMAHFSASGA